VAEVTIAQAMRELGVSYDTIRRRIRKGELTGRRVRMRQGMVWLVEIPDAPADAPASDQDTPRTADMPSGEVAALREHNAVLREQLAARTREVQELHVLLQGFQRALPSPVQVQEQAGAVAGVSPVHVPWWKFWKR